MEILLAEHAGFCYGVKRALQMAEQAIEAQDETTKAGSLVTLGPIIHNPQVVERLRQRGVGVLAKLDELSQGRVIIRSHGVSPAIYQEAELRSLEVIDATCPFVTRSQRIAGEYWQKGYQVIVVGDAKHPEIAGIIGWTDGKAWVVDSAETAKELPEVKRLAVLAQTTLPEKTFQAVVEVLRGKCRELKIHNTICSATGERQEAALALAKKVQVMIVVGGKESSNTRKLAKICHDLGAFTYHIETAQELHKQWFHGIEKVGVTAGASTPDWIIEEVVTRMTEMNQDQEKMEMDMGATLDESFKTFSEGELIKGIVAKVSHDEVLVDVGGKSEGVIPRKEISYRTPDDLGQVIQVGDEVECVVLKGENEDGNILLSRRRAEQRKVINKLSDTMDENATIEGEVTQVVKGGLLVDVGVRGFLPASLVERGYVENLETYVGQSVKVKVIEVDTNRGRAVLSRKAVLAEEAAKQKEETWASIEEAQVRKGIVRRLTNFGAFVDLGGVDGLLHISEMSWARIKHPSEVVKEGDEVEVYVLKLDRDHEKVSLSLKEVLPNPWDSAAERYPEGSVISVRVVRLTPFGAFCELEPGIDGLIHISQLADRRVNKPEEVVEIGQVVRVKVLEVRQTDQRISLSLRAVQDDEEQAETDGYLNEYRDDSSSVTIGERMNRD